MQTLKDEIVESSTQCKEKNERNQNRTGFPRRASHHRGPACIGPAHGIGLPVGLSNFRGTACMQPIHCIVHSTFRAAFLSELPPPPFLSAAPALLQYRGRTYKHSETCQSSSQKAKSLLTRVIDMKIDA